MLRCAQLVKVSAELRTLCDGIAMTVEQLVAGSMSSLSILSASIRHGTAIHPVCLIHCARSGDVSIAYRGSRACIARERFA